MTPARIAGAPISWGVCEVPGWGHQLAADRVLAEMHEVGLRATELGPEGFLPADRARGLLQDHGLTVVAGFVPVVLHDRPRFEHSLGAVASTADLIAALGGEVLVVAASTGRDGYEEAMHLDHDTWASLTRSIEELSELAARRGLRVAVHPHHGSAIEHPDDVERLLSVSDVGLCLDTGHVAVGGSDPLALASAAATRVVHVHLKDVAAALAERVAAGEIGYADAVREGLYRPLGDGDLDVPGIVGALEEAGYAGWYVLEHDEVLDDEPRQGSGPVRNVRHSLAFLERAWEEVAAGTRG